jgi:hypothetical protein
LSKFILRVENSNKSKIFLNIWDLFLFHLFPALQCRLTRKYYLLLKLRTKFGWKCLVFLNSQTLPNNIYWECKFCWQKLRQYFDRNKKDQQLWTIVETQNFYHIICIIHICKDKLQNTILKFTFINFFCPLFFDMVGACNSFRTMNLSQQCNNGTLKK